MAIPTVEATPTPSTAAQTIPYPVPADLTQWADDFEFEGGYPASDTPALIAWGQAEGGSFDNTAYGNVLNTTLGEPGSSSINSDGVQSFDIAGDTQAQDWTTGIDADIATIRQPNMAAINSALTTGNNAALPTALATDPWGTNPSTVATILGESSSQIAALGAAGSGSGAGASSTASLTGLNINPLDLFGIPQTLGGDAASAIWGEVGPFIAKAILVVAGLGVMLLGVQKLTESGREKLLGPLGGIAAADPLAAAA